MWRLSHVRQWLRRLLTVMRPGRAERELAREIASHLALLEQAFLARGLPPDEARRAARRSFGGVEQAKEHQRAARGVRWLDDARRDAPQALRVLGRTPGFTAVAILTLALGIGANTAIFSVVHTVLLQPLPYPDADRLVRIVEQVPAAETRSGSPEQRSGMQLEDFVAWRTQTQTLSDMAVYGSASMTLTAAGRAEAVRLAGARLSAAIFPMLGATPRLGRLFDAAEERRGIDTLIVLSDEIWQTHFAADPTIVGRTVTLDGRPHLVTGVMARAFEFPDRQTAFWIPFVASAPQAGRITYVPMIARLKDGVSMETASAEANTIGGRLLGIAPPASSSQRPPTLSPSGAGVVQRSSAPLRFEVVRVKDQLVAPVRSALVVFAVAVGCVLLIACANVANLQLARHASRQREIGIRAALGAGRSRLVRQVLMESLVLGLAGGAAALAVAFGGVQLLKAFATIDAPWWIAPGQAALLPRVDRIGIDGAVLLFTLCASLLTGALFAVGPVLLLSRLDQMPLVNDAPAAAGTVPGLRARSQSGARRVLVVVEVALATVLLVGAGLLIRSFVTLSRVDTGYDPTHVLTFQVVLPSEPLHATADNPRSGGPEAQPTAPGTRAPSPGLANQARLAFAQDLVTRLRSAPRVEAAGFTNILPLARGRWTLSFSIPGVPPEAVLDERPQTRFVSQDYLRAMGVRLIDGRWFGDRDAAGQPRAVLINRALARRYFRDARPVGTFVTFAQTSWEIVGIVDDVRQGGLDTEADPQYFVDFRQLPREMLGFPDPGGMFFAARADGDPLALVPDIRALVRQIAPQAALDSVFGMEHLVSSSIARPRFYAVLLGIFAVVAGALAAIGIYGVLAYSVVQRTREIGIRMALGAQRRQVLAQVLGQGARLTAIGMLLGLMGAVTVTRYLSTMLFGLTPWDPSTFVGVCVVFALTAMLATYVPARRATKVDPLIALRHD